MCEETFCKRLLDNQIIWYWISSLCVIIKGLDNQDQKFNYQINQYTQKYFIVNLGIQVFVHPTPSFEELCTVYLPD